MRHVLQQPIAQELHCDFFGIVAATCVAGFELADPLSRAMQPHIPRDHSPAVKSIDKALPASRQGRWEQLAQKQSASALVKRAKDV